VFGHNGVHRRSRTSHTQSTQNVKGGSRSGHRAIDRPAKGEKVAVRGTREAKLKKKRGPCDICKHRNARGRKASPESPNIVTGKKKEKVLRWGKPP